MGRYPRRLTHFHACFSYAILDRRPGDIAACYADATKARDELGWAAEYDMARMCAGGWRWQSQNPNGYGDAK